MSEGQCSVCGCPSPAHYGSCTTLSPQTVATLKSIEEERLERERARAVKIAANVPPVFLRSVDVVVEVVLPGTKIYEDGRDGPFAVVDERTVVQKGRTMFVTRAHWEALIGRSDVRKI